jgi:4-hydroxy-tetrahydrodipicolinate synthase
LYSLIAGAAGCFSGAGNAVAAELVQMYDHFVARNYEQALGLWHRIQPLNKLLWTAPFNPVAKAASNLSGRPVGECRRPVQPLPPETMEKVKAAMAAVRAG